MVVSITSPVTMNRITPSATGTPAERTTGGDVSVSIVVGSTAELIILVDVAIFFESGENANGTTVAYLAGTQCQVVGDHCILHSCGLRC